MNAKAPNTLEIALTRGGRERGNLLKVGPYFLTVTPSYSI